MFDTSVSMAAERVFPQQRENGPSFSQWASFYVCIGRVPTRATSSIDSHSPWLDETMTAITMMAMMMMMIHERLADAPTLKKKTKRKRERCVFDKSVPSDQRLLEEKISWTCSHLKNALLLLSRTWIDPVGFKQSKKRGRRNLCGARFFYWWNWRWLSQESDRFKTRHSGVP